MKTSVWLLIVVVILVIALVWCLLPKTQTVNLRVHSDGTIDDTYHEDAVLFTGERLRWDCQNCAEVGVDFGVTDVFLLADLDDIAHGLNQLYEMNEEGQQVSRIPRLQEDVGRLMGQLAAEPDAEAAEERQLTPPAAAQVAANLGEVGEVLEILAGIPRPADGPGEQPGPPFGDWEPPPPGSEPILSPPYAIREGSRLIKFTWITTRDGELVDEWDPHVPAHEKR